MKQPKRLALLLAVLMLVGGLSGCGQAESAQDAAYGIPTDKNGDNLEGNLAINRQNGGLLTYQGDSIFFAHFADGGSLYCQKPDGKTEKLTDFPVANLNVTGDVLVFTDIAACTVSSGDDVTRFLSADTHEEVWRAAGSDGSILYGGNLFCMRGIKDFCAGKSAIDDLKLIGLDNGDALYQASILSDGELIAVQISPPEQGADVSGVSAASVTIPAIMPLLARTEIIPAVVPLAGGGDWFNGGGPPASDILLGEGASAKLGRGPNDFTKNIATTGGKLYADMGSPNHNSYIAGVDTKSGKPLGYIDGATGVVSGRDGSAYFISLNDGLAYRIGPDGKIEPVSPLAPRSDLSVDENGDLRFKVWDSDTNRAVDVIVSKDNYKNVDGQRYDGQAQTGEYSSYVNLARDRNNRNVFHAKDGRYRYDPVTGKWSREVVKNYQVIDESEVSDWNKPGPGGVTPQWVIPKDFFEELKKDSSPPQNDENSEDEEDDKIDRNALEDELAKALKALVRTAQNYNYDSNGDISNYYTRSEFEAIAANYEIEWDFPDYTTDIAIEIRDKLELESSYGSQIVRAVEYWVKEFDFAVGDCVIDNSEMGGGVEGRAMLLINRRVHITNENIHQAIARAVNTEYGGLSGFQQAIKADIDTTFAWMNETIVDILKDPYGSGFMEEPMVTPAIAMSKDPEMGWVVDTLAHIRTHFIVIDPDIKLDVNMLLPLLNEGGSVSSGEPTVLEGVWQRIEIGTETIEFRGNQYIWSAGPMVIASGTFEIGEGTIMMTQASNGTSDNFSLSLNGTKMTLNGWEYRLKG